MVSVHTHNLISVHWIMVVLSQELGSTLDSVLFKDDSDPDPARVFRNFVPYFFSQIFLLSAQLEQDHRKRTRKLCTGVIKSKSIKGGEITRLDEGHSDSLLLDFTQLAHRCTCCESLCVFFSTYRWGRVYTFSDTVVFSDGCGRNSMAWTEDQAGESSCYF